MMEHLAGVRPRAPHPDERPKTRVLTAARIMRDPVIDRAHADVLAEVLADLAEQAEALGAVPVGKPTSKSLRADGTTYVNARVEVTIPRIEDLPDEAF